MTNISIKFQDEIDRGSITCAAEKYEQTKNNCKSLFNIKHCIPRVNSVLLCRLCAGQAKR